jgi:type I restriction enzyme S subunit
MGWDRKKLGRFLTLEYGKPLDKSLRTDDGIYPAYGANGVKCRSDQYFFDKATIIIGRKGSAGELTLTEDKFWPLDVTYFVKFDENKYDLMFIYYLLSLLNLPSLATGVKPGINRNNVYAIEVSIPELDEQKRLVAILDQAFADIEQVRAKTEQNLKNSRELFESYLQQVFSQRGEGWIDRSIEDICNFKHGFAFKSEYFIDDANLVLLTPGNFYEEGGYKYRGKKQKYYDGPFPQDFLLSKGSLLIAMTEQAAGLLGSPALVPEDDVFLHNQRLGLVELTSEFEGRVSMEFLFHLFNTKYFRAKVQGTASGLKVRHTSPKKMQAILISLPSDINEQNAIAHKLFEIKEKSLKLEDIYVRKLQQLDELKKSILQKAFTGELTKDAVA